ncbi:glycosyltransferase [Microbacterium sp. bgisy203]|uniref:glycosyltransferase n=1 Tax=Microbacterium sp. bgisy203 TaxID=3413799 RepID=UPI003D7617DE
MIRGEDVTLIVCTRERPEMLRDALASFLEHSPEGLEILVVDSASTTSKTLEVADEAGVRAVRTDIKGLSIARNVGLATARRPIVVYSDDDCRALPGWLDAALAHFDDERVAAVTGAMLHEASDTAARQVRSPKRYTKTLEGLDAGHGAVMAFRRDVVEGLGGFDPVMGAGRYLAGAEDLDIFCRILDDGRAIVYDAEFAIDHAHTREDDAYTVLHRGYGLGLGALADKWLRLRPTVGLMMSAVIVKRTVVRAVRNRSNVRRRDADLALLGGFWSGLFATAGMRRAGRVFVDARPPQPITLDSPPPSAEIVDDPIRGGLAASAKAELISSLDEKYLVNDVVFAAMCAAGTMIVDGASLRGADGGLDRTAIRRLFEGASWFAPALRQRLVSTPLGVTTPAWVPVSHLDMSRHVRFADGIVADDPELVDALTGRSSPPLDRSRPLWDAEFVELDSGRVAIVFRYHHVVGDALFGLRIGDVLAGPTPLGEPLVPGPEELRVLGVPPRGGIHVLWLAFASWRALHPSLPEMGAAYWRKSFRMRLRRWAGRAIRPVKNARIRRSDAVARAMTGRSSQYAVVDFAAATKRAFRLGGTVNDLTVAATLHGVAAQRVGPTTVSLLVPISRRRAGDTTTRNDISVVKVTVPADASLEEMVPLVRVQVQEAVDAGGSIVVGEADWVGYATYVTWGRDQRFVGTASVETVTGWPAGDPKDEVAVLACSYRRDLVVSVTVGEGLDRRLLMSSIVDAFAGQPILRDA